MGIVLLTALGVGGATVVGALIGFIFKNTSHKFNDIILGFASGVMLFAAIVGLILPAVSSGSITDIIFSIVGIFLGAITINFIDKLVPHLHNLVKLDSETHPKNVANFNKVMLFVIAIAIHNFPEGIASGVGFGSGNISNALTIAGGIALQNIPEGMVIIAPLLSSGISKRKTLLIASLTGLIEVVGTFIGYFAISISSMILPFALSFAGGTMIYVISDEMIPETHSHGNERGATFSLLFGLCLMLVFDVLI